jgi:ribose transport system permease protein
MMRLPRNLFIQTKGFHDPKQDVLDHEILNRLFSARAWIFLILLAIGFEIWAQLTLHATFLFNLSNLRSIAVAVVARLLLGMGQTFVVISGGIDLSVGFVMGYAAIIFAQSVNWASGFCGEFFGLMIAVLIALVACAIPGLINGWLIAKLKIPPFIGTLGMYGVARGTAYLLAPDTTVPVSNSILATIGNGSILGFPAMVWVTLLILLLLNYLLSQSRFGQHIYAIGGNYQAAARAGINVSMNIIFLYVLSALTAGVAGILYTAQFTSGAAQAGEPLLLDSIAAVVIGGASLFGGSGTILGTLIGALIIAVIQFGLVFLNVQANWQFIAVGIVIIISVLVDQSQKKLGDSR